NIFELAELFLDLNIETDFFLDLAHGCSSFVRIARLDAALGERPVAENVVHEGEVDIRAVLRIDHSSGFLLDRELREIDGLIALFLLRDLLLARLADLLVDGTEDAVDELAGRFPAEGLGELDGFVNSHLRRDLLAIAEEELGKADAQDIAVDDIDLLDRP